MGGLPLPTNWRHLVRNLEVFRLEAPEAFTVLEAKCTRLARPLVDKSGPAPAQRSLRSQSGLQRKVRGPKCLPCACPQCSPESKSPAEDKKARWQPLRNEKSTCETSRRRGDSARGGCPVPGSAQRGHNRPLPEDAAGLGRKRAAPGPCPAGACNLRFKRRRNKARERQPCSCKAERDGSRALGRPAGKAASCAVASLGPQPGWWGRGDDRGPLLSPSPPWTAKRGAGGLCSQKPGSPHRAERGLFSNRRHASPAQSRVKDYGSQSARGRRQERGRGGSSRLPGSVVPAGTRSPSSRAGAATRSARREGRRLGIDLAAAPARPPMLSFRLLALRPGLRRPPLSAGRAALSGPAMEKPVESGIRAKLQAALEPVHLEVINDSHLHAVPRGSETHFRVVVASRRFEGLSLIHRHRLVNDLLQEELAGPVHSLSIQAKTPQQWEKSPKGAPGPTCLGGSKHDPHMAGKVGKTGPP